MRDYFRLCWAAIRHSLTLSGSASRAELIAFVVISQLGMALIRGVTDFVLEGAARTWTDFSLMLVVLVPLPALVVRRLHDIGLRGTWGLIGLAVVAPALLLDLTSHLGADQTRQAMETATSYVSWLLYLPAFALAVILAAAPGRRVKSP